MGIPGQGAAVVGDTSPTPNPSRMREGDRLGRNGRRHPFPPERLGAAERGRACCPRRGTRPPRAASRLAPLAPAKAMDRSDRGTGPTIAQPARCVGVVAAHPRASA